VNGGRLRAASEKTVCARGAYRAQVGDPPNLTVRRLETTVVDFPMI
jgi:hypothetical protein